MYTKSYPSNNTAAGNMSRRRSDVDTGEGHFFKLIEIPFSPFQNEFGAGDDDDDEFDYPAARRSYHGNYGSTSTSTNTTGTGIGNTSRQEFLRSYTFSRKQTMQERVKSRLGRFKAAACAVVACNYSLSRRIRRIMKEKLALKSFRHDPFHGSHQRLEVPLPGLLPGVMALQ